MWISVFIILSAVGDGYVLGVPCKMSLGFDYVETRITSRCILEFHWHSLRSAFK